MLLWTILKKSDPKYFDNPKETCKSLKLITPTIEGLKQENKEAEALIKELSEMEDSEKERLARHLVIEKERYKGNIKYYKTIKLMIIEDKFYEITPEHLEIAKDTRNKLTKLQRLLKKDLGAEEYEKQTEDLIRK